MSYYYLNDIINKNDMYHKKLDKIIKNSQGKKRFIIDASVSLYYYRIKCYIK